MKCSQKLEHTLRGGRRSQARAPESLDTRDVWLEYYYAMPSTFFSLLCYDWMMPLASKCHVISGPQFYRLAA